MRPNSSCTRSTDSQQNISSPTSPLNRIARLPSSSTRRAVSFASDFSSRYRIAIKAPSRAIATATARPMPLSPPVMTATLSLSLPTPGYFGR